MSFWALSLPGLLAALFVLAVIERFTGRILRRRRRTPLSSSNFDQVDALFYATKHYELDQRASVEMLREETGDRAPRLRLDLD